MARKGTVLLAIVNTAICLLFWVHLGESQEHKAQKVWHNTTAEVVHVSDVQNDGVSNGYRIADLLYHDFYGREKTASGVTMSYNKRIGDQEPINVSSDGRLWIKNDLNETREDPRHISPDSIIFGWGELAIISSVAVGTVAAMIEIAVVTAVISLLSALVRLISRPLLLRLAWRKLSTFVRRIYDSVKLRMEFYRRRKRIRPSPAYKQIRRFQAELARMDPTPGVIAARRKANGLLTKVLERDNQRVEVINGVIDGIREEVDLDQKARREAQEELKSSEM